MAIESLTVWGSLKKVLDRPGVGQGGIPDL